MTRSWGYPPQKRPDPGRYGPFNWRPLPFGGPEILEQEQRDARDRSKRMDGADAALAADAVLAADAEPVARERPARHRPRDGGRPRARRRRRGRGRQD